MKRFFLMMSAAILLQVSALAQVNFSGTVKDAVTQEAVAGAHVFLNGSYRGTFTDPNGHFIFSRLETGMYTFSVTHVSYAPLEEQVTVTSGEPAKPVSFMMTPRVHMSEEFIVSAVRSSDRLPGASTTVSREALRTSNMGQDIPFLLSTQPSLVVTSDAGTGIGYTGMRIRGVDQNRINVTINGIPLNDPESHSVYWVDLPDFASSVEEIQIQRGVGTSTNGAGAFGGSVNIRTEQLNPKPYGSVQLAGGSFNTLKSTVSFGTGLTESRLAFDGRMSHVTSGGFIDRGSSDLFSYYASGGYYGKRTVIKAILMSGHERTYQAWEGIPSEILDTNRTWNPAGLYYAPDGSIQFYDNQVDDYLQNHYQLHLLHRINHRWNLNAALHLTTGFGFYESYKVNRKLSNYGLPPAIYGIDTLKRTDLIQRKYLDNRFYGATWSLIRTTNTSTLTLGGAANAYDGDHYGTLVWMQYPGEVSKDHRWYFNNGMKRDVNLFAKYLRQITSKLHLFADVQGRYIDYQIDGIDDDLRDIGQQHVFGFINPKAGIGFKHNEHHESWLFAGIANREPNRSNFTDAPAGGPVPTDERLYNLELGHRISLGKLMLNLNTYLMYYQNQLVLTGEINDVGSPIMTNVTQSYRAGVELQAGARITRWFTWEANAAFSRNEILDFTAYVDDWDTWSQREEHLGKTPIAFSPALVANNILRFQPTRQLSVAVISQYVGKQYLDNTGDAARALDAWLVHHLTVSYPLTIPKVKEFKINLMVNNILNHAYESNGWIYRYYEGGNHQTMDGLFPQAGIHVLGGVSMKF